MKIGVDLDGVLYNFAASLRKYMVAYEGYTEDQLPDPTCWNFFEDDWGIDLNTYLDFCAKGVDAGIVFRYGSAQAGARQTIDEFRSEGHTVHIVTHRFFGKKSVQNTENWLLREKIQFDTLTFSRDKTVVPVDIFIEDNVDNYNALVAAGTRVVLLDRPWNRYAAEAERVFSWYEFADVVWEMIDDGIEEQQKPNENILQEAHRLVHGNRNTDYGHPLDDFSRSAQIWSAVLGVEVKPEQIPLCMIGVKLSRETNHRKRDNLVDIAGYAETLQMLYDESERRSQN